MSKLKNHTPGPWMVSDLGNGLIISPASCADDLIPSASVVRNCVARIPVPEPFRDDIWSESKANARLVAAAPEMLRMLKLAVCAMMPNDGEVDKFSEHRGEIEAIIAKAEGR